MEFKGKEIRSLGCFIKRWQSGHLSGDRRSPCCKDEVEFELAFDSDFVSSTGRSLAFSYNFIKINIFFPRGGRSRDNRADLPPLRVRFKILETPLPYSFERNAAFRLFL